jgi:hypothetical protein
MDSNYISCDNFKKKLVDLCLRSGLNDFPTKRRDQLVLLKSIAISFDPNRVYTEVAVNNEIKLWLEKINYFPSCDYMMLRRRLVDDGLLTRNPDGSGYWISPTGPVDLAFDPAITGLDVRDILDEGQKLIAQKKAAYLLK